MYSTIIIVLFITHFYYKVDRPSSQVQIWDFKPAQSASLKYSVEKFMINFEVELQVFEEVPLNYRLQSFDSR